MKHLIDISIVKPTRCNNVSNLFILEWHSTCFGRSFRPSSGFQAATTKNAQIPFSSWLPAAMAAPTPVSALVHSSTLVTAGVYLLIRFRPSFSYWLNVILLLVSGLTMFMAGFGANFEFDLRIIIAVSTLRQLGLMIMTVAVCTIQQQFHSLQIDIRK